MPINTDSIQSILQAFQIGHSMASQQQQLEFEKQKQAADLKERQAQLKQQQEQFDATLENTRKQFEARQSLDQANHEAALLSIANVFQQNAARGINPPGYSESGRESLQVKPGVAGTSVKYSPSEELKKFGFPNISAPSPETENMLEEERQRAINAPKFEEEQKKIKMQNDAKAAINAASNNTRLQISQQNAAAAYSRGVEIQKLKNGPAYAKIEVEKAKIAQGLTKLSQGDAAKLQYLNSIETKTKELEDELNSNNGYSYYQGPAAGIMGNLTAFRGEDDPQYARIRTLAGELRGLITTAEAGKTLSKSEKDLLDTHAPAADHMIPAEQIRQQIRVLKESIPQMRDDIYAHLAGSNPNASNTNKPAPKIMKFDKDGNPIP